MNGTEVVLAMLLRTHRMRVRESQNFTVLHEFPELRRAEKRPCEIASWNWELT